MSLVNTETGELVTITVEEAQALTESIKGAAEQVWSLLLEAHERQAWATLGYSRWEDYVRTEFDMSRSRSYHLLDQGRVIREISAAAGVSTTVDITERQVRDIKPHLKEVTDTVRERIAEEAVKEAPERVEEIVKQVVKEQRAKAAQRSEDKAALKQLGESAIAAGIDQDEDRIRQRGEFSRLCRDIANLPAAEAFLARQGSFLSARHISQAEQAYAWLDTFLLEVKERS